MRRSASSAVLSSTTRSMFWWSMSTLRSTEPSAPGGNTRARSTVSTSGAAARWAGTTWGGWSKL
ncbi:hypothetical protein F751_1493 [Auxenochlorella protothecoides]|uniref:Uncharacterized protein n=1 Tax=Auxenochlorella protothecoides TaxID=3075 RepID=A0A087SJH5_AUXPR|nr:hypothetical protein F751_1493 [Auxenochlorella protothecoides]KFM25879.1 hypothetical protein F751_1493 [Auxenochlorella protothecoides]